MVSSIAAAIISKKRRELINSFKASGAIGKQNAKTLKEIGLDKRLLLEIQKLNGVIIEIEPGIFYLDLENEIQARSFRRKVHISSTVLIILVILLIKILP